MSDVHSCVRRGSIESEGKQVPRFTCQACSFHGTLIEAIWHAIRNQFIPRG